MRLYAIMGLLFLWAVLGSFIFLSCSASQKAQEKAVLKAEEVCIAKTAADIAAKLAEAQLRGQQMSAGSVGAVAIELLPEELACAYAAFKNASANLGSGSASP